jgi:hypothetical protein
MTDLQEESEKTGRSPENLEKENELSAKLDLVYKKEDAFWRQKSRIQRLKEGDRNTTFFHGACQSHRPRNRIHRIISADNKVIERQENLCKEVEIYLKNLLSDLGQRFPQSTESSLANIPRIIRGHQHKTDRAYPRKGAIRGGLFSEERESPRPEGFPDEYFRKNVEFCENRFVRSSGRIKKIEKNAKSFEHNIFNPNPQKRGSRKF